MKTALIATLLALLAGCGGPFFYAEVEDPAVCITLPSVAVPAAPPLDVGAQTVTWNVTFDVGANVPGLTRQGTTANIHTKSLKVTSTTDMSVVTDASVALLDAKGDATPFMHYTQQPPVPDPHVIAMTLDQDPNLFDALVDGKLLLQVGLTGKPPQEAWSTEITVCVSATVKVKAL